MIEKNTESKGAGREIMIINIDSRNTEIPNTKIIIKIWK
jgi:hypothetical protein